MPQHNSKLLRLSFSHGALQTSRLRAGYKRHHLQQGWRSGHTEEKGVTVFFTDDYLCTWVQLTMNFLYGIHEPRHVHTPGSILNSYTSSASHH